MRRTRAVLATLTVCGCLGAAVYGSEAWAADILVARGGQVETVTAPAPSSSVQRVSVFRGEGLDEPKASHAAPSAEPTWAVVGGDRLWIVDTADGQIVACYLVSTTQVSERAIRCVASTPN